MKKLVLFFGILLSLTLSACGGEEIEMPSEIASSPNIAKPSEEEKGEALEEEPKIIEEEEDEEEIIIIEQEPISLAPAIEPTSYNEPFELEEAPTINRIGFSSGKYVPDRLNGLPTDDEGERGERAGVFGELFNGYYRSSWNGTTDIERITDTLNGYCKSLYGLSWQDGGIARTIWSNEWTARFASCGDWVGIDVFSWRDSFNSDERTNARLNMVLEAFRYMTKNSKVAHALWSYVDELAVNGNANPCDFGFSEVSSDKDGMVVQMDGKQIRISPNANGICTLWFKYA